MSDILNSLGVDREDFDWWHLAACSGMEPNLLYDQYEIDINVAKNIDEMCLSCPVIKMCHDEGIGNNEWGVWGGVYLTLGVVDKARNMHKTPEVWKRLKKKNVH